LKYRILIEKRVEKDASKIPAKFRATIDKAILALASDPRPKGCKKLTDKEGYRIRVGNYRVL
jgi:mRNA interferase RelE/StbE